MGFDLSNFKGQEFRVHYFYFRKILALAEYFGWEPMGTVMPEETAKAYLGDKGSDEEGVQGFIEIRISDGRHNPADVLFSGSMSVNKK